jgi:hypothetical protein
MSTESREKLLASGAAMASGLRSGEAKPRRFDLTMSRRTRRPAAATVATGCEQAVDVEGLGFLQPVVVLVQPEERRSPDGRPFCLPGHPQPRQPEDAHQEHEASEPSTEEECQDRRFSLQELIEDEAVDVAATGGTTEGNAPAAGVGEFAQLQGAAAGEATRRAGQVPAGRRVIGMVRRYVKVRSIKPKRASPSPSPEKCASPVC